MDAETLATITTLAGAAKTTIEAIRAALSGSKGREAKASDALGLIADLQSRVLALQEIAFRLHQEKMQAVQEKNAALEENGKLREQVRQKEERAANRERYERRRLGQSVVVVLPEEPEVYLCATCFEAGEKVYLSRVPRELQDMGTHRCQKCKGFAGA